MTRKLSWFTALLLGTATLAQAAPQPSAPEAPRTSAQIPLPTVSQPLDANAPLRDSQLLFNQVAPPPGSMTLRGTEPTSQIEFGVRSDEVVTRALLTLSYRPSPALIPTLSQLKVYLNDELVGLVTVTADQLGKRIKPSCRSIRVLLAILTACASNWWVTTPTCVRTRPTAPSGWISVKRASSI